MFETKIENLTNAIERLIAVMDRVVVAPDLSPKPKAKAPKADPEPEVLNTDTVPSLEKLKVATQLPGRDRLQAKCLELVKADRINKARITDLIAQHSDGGKLIKDIGDDNLTAFAEALEAL